MVEFTKKEKAQIKKGNKELEDYIFNELKIKKEEFPTSFHAKEEGSAVVKAYPILGLEKYLGMYDKENRLAYFPSLKLNHDSVETVCYANFSKHLEEDIIIINDTLAEGKNYKRVKKVLDAFRKFFKHKTKCLIISKHFPKTKTKGKGLGMSAAAGGAVAFAVLQAVAKEYAKNNRFLSVLARYLSGSATSSAAGHYSVWFSYEGIKSKDSYAVMIKKAKKIAIVTVPIKAGFTTTTAHKAAVKSPLYKYWALNKPKNVLELTKGIAKGESLSIIGRHAELDALNLFHLLVSGANFFNWQPPTLALMQEVTRLREQENLECYYTMDTGPSVAILCHKNKAKDVEGKIKDFIKKELNNAFDTFVAYPAGKPEKLKNKDLERLLSNEVIKILKEKGIYDLVR